MLVLAAVHLDTGDWSAWQSRMDCRLWKQNRITLLSPHKVSYWLVLLHMILYEDFEDTLIETCSILQIKGLLLSTANENSVERAGQRWLMFGLRRISPLYILQYSWLWAEKVAKNRKWPSKSTNFFRWCL